ncbi:hypothetical protein Pcaca04_22660 [Pectobacterium carotovorum subsp. carotovorum]|nr:hypothetical protein Pcaca04_22660 [Pectobacterium carotovorum subsp. carotovorum]
MYLLPYEKIVITSAIIIGIMALLIYGFFMSCFNINLFPRNAIDNCYGLYSINEKNDVLNPVTYVGTDFSELKNKLKIAGLYNTAKIRQRFKNISEKTLGLLEQGESIKAVYFHLNNEMIKPAFFICLYHPDDTMQGRVICSSVDMVIESGHHCFNRLCNFYYGEWQRKISKSNKPYIWVNMSKKISENPIFVRGRSRGIVKYKPEIN